MKQLLITTLLLCVSWVTPLAATTSDTPIEAPDFIKIERAINNPQSPYYYPDLMKKFHSNDTTMTLQEFRHLYYGYALQEDYSPYRITSTTPPSMKSLYDYNTEQTPATCDTVIAYAHKCLDNIPIDTRQLYLLYRFLSEKGEDEEATLWKYRYDGIVKAILSSGDGKTPETAWHVIFASDEYNLLNRQGYWGTERIFVEPYFDFIVIQKNPLKIEGFYFNILQILQTEHQKHYTR